MANSPPEGGVAAAGRGRGGPSFSEIFHD
jgi:hypothetical protein